MKNMYSSARNETNIFSVSDRLLKFCPNNMGPSSFVNEGGTKTKGGSRTSTPGVCHPIWNNCFCKFRLILHNMHNLSCNVYNILCISYAQLWLQKHLVYMKELKKQSPDPKNSTAPGPRSPVLKFLDPPLKAGHFCTSCAEEGLEPKSVNNVM